MKNQEQAESWDEIKELWNNSAKGDEINFQFSTLISELKSKMSEFETNSIKSDITQIKSSWNQYKEKVSPFEKKSIASDLKMITEFIKKILQKMKLK
ncbi:hypothetical protein [Algoriphagus aquimarinus]|uniref:Uncharacterized protein n=1 Tax=Algoriphagus aquimarinus TaxID=237018 RepID=A0A1I1BV01_9BACT|nr:hypothetical protein [Algoriphagus aquimarinus]SFB54245.1 hypothetical protein SAMN04489723_11855 [Algoriphagus aquimarinus]